MARAYSCDPPCLPLPSPWTASSQAFSVNSFRWRIRDENRSDHVTRNAQTARNNEARRLGNASPRPDATLKFITRLPRKPLAGTPLAEDHTQYMERSFLSSRETARWQRECATKARTHISCGKCFFFYLRKVTHREVLFCLLSHVNLDLFSILFAWSGIT